MQITYKSAWFLSHRIREAMRTGALAPMGVGGGEVEADETFIGRKKDHEVKQGVGHKNAVLHCSRGGRTLAKMTENKRARRKTVDKTSSQIQQFRDSARELSCDESEDRFRDALRTVAKHKPKDEKKRVTKP